jgi:hypothetical protein
VPWGIPTDDRSPDAPTYEQLVVENSELRAQVVALESELADLEERIGRNPRNSSMPPSAEGFTKPPSPSRAERRAAQRKQGKQPGAPGKHLAQVADPDAVVIHTPDACRGCGGDLSSAEAEPVKPFGTTTYDFFCTSVSIVGLLIHAVVGSLGGLGRRFPNRHGLAA